MWTIVNYDAYGFDEQTVKLMQVSSKQEGAAKIKEIVMLMEKFCDTLQ